MVTVKELQESLKSSNLELRNYIKEEIESVKSFYSVQLSEQAGKIATLEAEVINLKQAVACMKGVSSKLTKLEAKCEDEDAYKRRDVIVLSGSSLPIVSNEENCSQMAINLMKNALDVQLQPSDISTCHRLGRPKSGSVDRRGLIVKLCRRDNKSLIMSAARNKKPLNLYVSEHLTPMRNTIMFALRRMKKHAGSRVVGCGSTNGKVSAWVKPPNSDVAVKMEVNNRNTLEHVSTTFAGVGLSEFVPEWRH